MSQIYPASPVFIGRLLQKVLQEINQRIVHELKLKGYHDITPGHAELLAQIVEHGSNIVDLAQKLGITKQAAGETVRQLEAAHYVRKSSDPHDARSILVQLDDKGTQLVYDAREVKAMIEAKYVKVLGAQPYRSLRAALEAATTVLTQYQ